MLETVVDISSRQLRLESRADNIEQHVQNIQVSDHFSSLAVRTVLGQTQGGVTGGGEAECPFVAYKFVKMAVVELPVNSARDKLI